MRTALYVVVAALLVSIPGRLCGQQALGDGRALDNSLRVGSGGKNTPQPKANYSARNAVITGNVAGLSYFHGNVPYRAPGEFHGNLGSNRLFRFHARSLPVDAPGTVYALGPQRVYRSMTGLDVKDVVQAPPGTNLLAPRDAVSVGGRAQRTPGGDWVGAHSPAGISVGIIQKSEGRALDLTTGQSLGIGVNEQRDALNPGPLGRPLRPEQANHDSAEKPSDEPAPDDVPQDLLGRRTTARPSGQVLPPRIEPYRFDGARRSVTDQLTDVEARLPIPHPAIHVKPGADFYLDLLLKFDRNRQRRADRTAPSIGTEPKGADGAGVRPTPKTSAEPEPGP